MGGGMMGGMNKVFGKMDPDATNSMLDGKVVATGTPGATEVADPNKGLNFGNMMARGLVRGTGQGLQAQSGMQNNMRSGGAVQMPQAQQPQLDAAAYGNGWGGMPYRINAVPGAPWLADAPEQHNWDGQPSQPAAGFRPNRNALYGG